MATTKHNLNEKYLKRLRLMRKLNDRVSELATRKHELTPSEQRSLTIAFRNIRRAYDDAKRIQEQLHQIP